MKRDIVQGTTQATSGNRALKISCSADYQPSKLLTRASTTTDNKTRR
ncbi:MAG: hypothetical protein LBN06_06810 [Prevotellaceae bacterium]|nr:hypothetical protein [Prevotellaceae bacterium]